MGSGQLHQRFFESVEEDLQLFVGDGEDDPEPAGFGTIQFATGNQVDAALRQNGTSSEMTDDRPRTGKTQEK